MATRTVACVAVAAAVLAGCETTSAKNCSDHETSKFVFVPKHCKDAITTCETCDDGYDLEKVRRLTTASSGADSQDTSADGDAQVTKTDGEATVEENDATNTGNKPGPVANGEQSADNDDATDATNTGNKPGPVANGEQSADNDDATNNGEQSGDKKPKKCVKKKD